MRAHDGKAFANISATTATFALMGGVYCVDVLGANWGTVTLSRLGPDGSTYVTAVTAFSANGTSGAVALPPGTYKFTIASADTVYASVTPIPGE